MRYIEKGSIKEPPAEKRKGETLGMGKKRGVWAKTGILRQDFEATFWDKLLRQDSATSLVWRRTLPDFTISSSSFASFSLLATFS